LSSKESIAQAGIVRGKPQNVGKDEGTRKGLKEGGHMRAGSGRFGGEKAIGGRGGREKVGTVIYGKVHLEILGGVDNLKVIQGITRASQKGRRRLSSRAAWQERFGRWDAGSALRNW